MTINVPHQNKPEVLKAGAPLCPICCVELLEAEVDFEIDGTILRNVKVLRCPICQEEHFTPEQRAVIEKKMASKV
jgi:YgiT-type zinc finger domain-containing protein